MMKKRFILFLLLGHILFLSGCGHGGTVISTAELKRQIEEENFIFYSLDNDTKHLQEIVEALEDSYLPLTQKLGVNLNEKTKVYVYPNEASLKNAVNRNYKFMLGYAGDKEIHIVSLLSLRRGYTKKDFRALAIHEFVHVLVKEINTVGVHLWLDEGLAAYEAQQMYSQWTRRIKQSVANGTVPSLDDLKWQLYEVDDGYAFSYTIVEYIVAEYGYEKLIELISSPYNFNTVLGVDKVVFEENWNSFLKESYK